MSSTDRANCWSITINNPTPDDEEQINQARQKGWKVEGQLEKGDNGTPHYQLVVRTPQVRFSTLKKQFTRAHIEIARNPTALTNYCSKEDTRQGELPSASSMYPSQIRYYALVCDYINNEYSSKVEEPDEYPRIKTPALDVLDEATHYLIRSGYVVETIAVNPATRAQWKTFHKSIYHRWHNMSQTDRQTDTESVEEVAEVEVPILFSQNENITNAPHWPCPCPSS